MNAAVKVIGGIILILIGLWLFASTTNIAGYTINWLRNFGIVVTGLIPIGLILVGLFVVWLEADELKTQKELAKETKSSRKRK